MRRLTRLTNAFSKKWENLRAAIARHFAYYNFCRVHSSLRVTPAMEAGLTDHVWTIAELTISISETILDNFHYLKPWIAPALFLLAIFFFEYDRRKPHDPRTLKGRTSKLRDQMKAFLDGLGPMPQDETTGVHQVRVGPDWRSPDGIMHNSAIVRATGPMSQRIAKVDYGYELYFAAPALRIYNEFGFRGVMDDQMKELLFKKQQYNKEFALMDMIQALSRLAELKEAIILVASGILAIVAGPVGAR